MTHIVTWWAALSWSHAALIALLVLIILAALGSLLGKCMAINDLPPSPRLYPLADYSAQYEQKRDWLGDRFLLAKPINRPRQTELPALLKRQAN